MDKSLEPKLGQCIGTGATWNQGIKQETGRYEAPKLYLGHTLLVMARTNIATYDFKQLSARNGRPFLGVLGMDCLKHYCIQLDFAARRMRFFDGERVNIKGWGKPFSLADLGDGCFMVSENLAGAKGLGSMVDTGYAGDGWLATPLFQQWTNPAALPMNGETRCPTGVLGGEMYPDMDLQGFDAPLLSHGDSDLAPNGIGLTFLSRHLVTFDFPRRTMYLKRTSIGPLVDNELEAAANAAAKSAVKALKRMKQAGQLPGWSKADEATGKGMPFNFCYPDSGIFDLQKQGDSFIYHFEFAQEPKTGSWKLRKAWRADQSGHTVEDYPVGASPLPDASR